MYKRYLEAYKLFEAIIVNREKMNKTKDVIYKDEKGFTSVLTGKKYEFTGAPYNYSDLDREYYIEAMIDYPSAINVNPYDLINIEDIKNDFSVSTEKTLAIIKPDAMNNIDKILEMFYANGLKVEKFEVRRLDEEILSNHYSHLVEKPFYGDLQKFMMSKPVAVMVLKGNNAVEKLRALMGPTDSTKALKNTIRGKFGTDKMYNAIHGSDSTKSAEIEINRFFKQKQKRI